MDNLDRRRKRAALNQSLFREVNERIAGLSRRYADELRPNAYVCECLSTDCSATLELPHEEYERVRKHSTWFFVLPGHQDEAVEDVVEANERYVIVIKNGVGSEVAEAMSSREIGARS